ncbi:putative protein kinase UbiB [Poriferisphaera corsica]|uniref:ABC1 atypical kinase-like domain-containing protein n=1 Tax=Poriferisphaera corsica TaxID=2528020 RepID=A0A517YSW1_9BACT|nr:AarF/UbiB family protein [Poriferisphaera corsica]QDU33301.1 putative protein kinase UbiB [Poriferisphaera corsica]
MPLSNLKSTVRNAKRYADIAHVLLRYGFGDILASTGLNRFLKSNGDDKDPSSKTATPPEKNNISDLAELPRPVRMRRAMEELGPTFIKLGQILSTRGDLLDSQWIDELKKLQDECPPFPYNEVEAILKDEFGDQLFKIFKYISPQPLAAASVAQVHRATLANNTKVVIKVLRPNIREVLEADMSILETVAKMLEKHDHSLGFSPTEVVQEFAQEIHKEVNLTNEGRAADRLSKYFAENPNIFFPEIFWHATTRNILTMKEVHGLRLSQYKQGDLTKKQLQRVLANCADAVFQQCLEFGFFHADPHTGNIFVLDNQKVCFIDCGMVGQIDKRTAEQLGDLVSAVIDQNTEKVIRAVALLVDLDPDVADQRKFRSDVTEFIGHFRINEIAELNLGNLLGEFFDLLRRYNIKCPSDLVFLIKAMTTIEGVAEQLDPTFDLVGHVEPHLTKLIKQRISPTAIRHRIQRTISRYIDIIEDAPSDILGLLNHLRHNQFTINFELAKLEQLDNTIEHASRSTSQALIIAALLIASSMLILSDRIAQGTGYLLGFGVLGYILAFIMVSWLFVTTHFRKRK